MLPVLNTSTFFSGSLSTAEAGRGGSKTNFIESIIDVDSCVRPVSDEAASGDDLSYDADFLELERLLEPKLADGRTPGPNELNWSKQVEWNAVQELATGLFERTRDLRVGVALTRALLMRQGMLGFAAGMHLLRRMIDEHWATLHPELEPLDEGLPPTRTNILNGLASAESVLLQVRTATLVADPQAGRFSYRDYQIASGEIDPPAEDAESSDEDSGPVATLSQIEGAFRNMDPEASGELLGSIDLALEDVQQIDAFITEAIGSMNGPDLTELVALLRDVRRMVIEFAGVEDAAEAAGEDDAAGTAAAAPAAGVPGTIGNRQDAIKALERVAEYFERNEPSSPVPLMLDRTKRMISMNFMELLEDLNPDAVSTVRHIVGGSTDE
ncbi:MAG: type VI secretion system protein TssA [Pseudomonadota bacterium]